MKKQTSHILVKSLVIIAIACFLIGLAGYAYLGSFIRLIGDDYCYAGIMTRDGFWGGQVQSYFQDVPYHGDRYFLTFISFILSLLPAEFNGWMPLLTLVLFCIGNYLLIRSLLKRWQLMIPRAVEVLLAVGIAYFTMLLAPTVNQSLYFRSAMLPSFAPIIGTEFLVAWLIGVKKPRWFTYLFVTLFAFFNAGLSENGAAFQGMALGVLLVGALYDGWKSHWKNMHALAMPGAGIIGTVISILVMYISPSTSDMLESGKISLFSALQLSFRHSWQAYSGFFSTKYLLVVVLVAFGAFAVILAGKRAVAVGTHNSLLKLAAVAFAAQVISLAMIFALMISSAYSRGVYPDPRHLIGVEWVMIVNLIVVGGCFGVIGMRILDKFTGGVRTAAIFVAAVLVVAIGILYPVRYLPQTIENRSLFQFWSEQWDLRDAVIWAAADEGQTEVHVLHMDHIIEDVGELGPDPDHNWYNQCAENYYGIQIYADQPGWEAAFNEFLTNRE